jgi:plastocyanin
MTTTISSTLRRTALVTGALLALMACGGDSAPAGDSAGGTARPSGSDTPAPTPTGTVITIEMVTDEEGGNYYNPKEVTAKPGDVLRFVLVTGVHNVHFVADSNPGATGLPPMSSFAQLPQQTIDIPVTMAPGKRYFYQCDPHAMLGMVGYVTVEP